MAEEEFVRLNLAEQYRPAFVAAVVGVTTIYVDLRASSRDNSENIIDLKFRVEAAKTKQTMSDLELAILKTNADNMLRILQEIKTDVRDIKRQGSLP